MRHLCFLFILLYCLTGRVFAQADECNTADCINEQQLYLSLAVGYGQRSNPLHGGEKLDMVILPDIYYYGKYLFFDNGRLGSSLQLSDNWQLSLMGQLNQEKGYFQKWFSGNVLQFSSVSYPQPSRESDTEKLGPYQATIQQIRKRRTAFDAGLQLDWFNNNWQFQAAIWNDVSNTYNGQHASIAASRNWHGDYGNWQLTGRLYWKSARLIDAYYGIHDDEAFYTEQYQGQASWQPELRLDWNKPLTERVGLIAFLRYLKLDSAMTESPLVRTDNVTTWFLGVSYRFF
ncbi:MipA/OmpV family protein [Chromatiaceae bacterium AAb-1]|nr:MipA/OmpV family protein [Chromatiaceae bacterium AAb-1]